MLSQSALKTRPAQYWFEQGGCGFLSICILHTKRAHATYADLITLSGK